MYALLVLCSLMFFSRTSAQTVIVGASSMNTNGSDSDPVDGYFNAMHYQTVYTAAELSAAGLPAWCKLTGLGFSVSQDYGGGNLGNYTIKLAGTSATDCATHNTASLTQVRSPFNYNPTVTAAGSFDMITFTSNFTWDGVSNILVDICTGDVNPYTSPYGGVRGESLTNGSRRIRDDASGSMCGLATSDINDNRPQIQFSYTPGAPPACIAATGLAVSNITTSGAQFDWSPPSLGTPSSYELYINTSTTAPTTTTSPTVTGITGLTYTSTTLLSGTQYHAWIRSNCGGSGTSDWSNAADFMTVCAPITTLPWTENFDALTSIGATSFPPCWLKENGDWATVINTTSDYDANARSAPNFLTEAWSATDEYIWTPPFQLTAGTSYDFSFWFAGDTYDGWTGDVFYNTTQNSAGATQLGTSFIDASTISTPTYVRVRNSFTPPTTGAYYFAIRVNATSNPYYLSFDDFKLELTPTCTEPTALQVSAITAAGGQLDWTSPSGSTPSSYDIYYSTSSAPPTATTSPIITGVTATTYTFTTLNPATTYYIWVRSNCGSGDLSDWSATATLLTNCAPVATFTENFDAVTTPALPVCWAQVGSSGEAYTQNTNSSSGTNCLYMYGDAFEGMPVVSLPLLSNINAGTHQLSFKMRANYTPGDVLEVGYLTDPADATTFTLLQSFTTTSLTYQSYSVQPGTTPGPNDVLAFRHAATIGYSILIDDVKWDVIPSCVEPTAVIASNITTTSVQLDWTAPSGGTPPATYEVYYNTANTPPTAATAPTITGITGVSTTISTLSPSTLYYVWVRSNCGGGSTSDWSNAINFTTACNAITTFPWTENFDALPSLGATSYPPCWLKENGDWSSVDDADNSYNDSHSAPNYIIDSWSATDEYMWTPGFQLTAGTSYDFSFWFVGDGYDGWTGDVFYNSVQNSAGATQLGTSFIDASTVSSMTYTKVKNSFTPSTTGEYYFAIRVNATSNPYYLGFDDFKLELTPACVEPSGITASSITATDAQIDWTSPSTGTPVAYDLYYSTSNTPPTAVTAPTVPNLTTTSTTLSPLTIGTTYYVWVRSQCGVDGNSAWSDVYSFSTPPANDDCAAATTLFNNVTLNGTTLGAGESQPADACNGYTSTSGIDVWYTFTPSQNGDAVVTVTPGTSTMDVVIQAYEGACGGFTNIGCADDETDGDAETISLTNLSAGGTYYIRVYGYTETGYGTAGLFTINANGSAIVPVTLTDLHGERKAANTVRLDWGTAVEVNNAGFEIQRSADGVNYSKIAFVKSKVESGYSNAALQYVFIDEQAFSGNNYYRLKQIDKDNKFTLSKVVFITGLKVNKLELSRIYPNPVASRLNLVIASPKSDKVNVVVTDIAGKVIMQQASQVVSGDNNIALNVQMLKAGNYLIKVVCADGCETTIQKFMKQ